MDAKLTTARIMDAVRVVALAQLLYQNFDMSFSRAWEDVPDHCKEHWLAVARELDPTFRQLYTK